MVRRALARRRSLALALAPGGRVAHATLQATVPERGAKLDAPPAQVVFRFDEAVEASFGALRVFDSEGQEVQTGKAFHPGGKGAEIAIKLKPGLGDGTYTATYRVVSADGHPISSGFVFTVGEASAPDRVARPAAGGRRHRPGHQHRAGRRARRPVRRDRARPRRADLLPRTAGARRLDARSRGGSSGILLVAALAGLLSAVAALVLQGAVGQGGSFWAAAEPDVVGEVLGTRFGRAWGIGALAWLVVLAVLATRPLRRAATRSARAGPTAPARRRRSSARRARAASPTAAAAASPAPAAVAARAVSPPRARRARGPALRARAAALARRPHERAVAGRDPAAREHPARAGDERVARRRRRARARAARRDGRARARRADAAAGRHVSRASPRSPAIALPVLLLSGVRAGDHRGRQLPRAARHARSGAPC